MTRPISLPCGPRVLTCADQAILARDARGPKPQMELYRAEWNLRVVSHSEHRVTLANLIARC